MRCLQFGKLTDRSGASASQNGLFLDQPWRMTVAQSFLLTNDIDFSVLTTFRYL